ncbi:unnamed protein product [Paramecium sonneborni]|uniref:Alpha-type protein kinase domain-containing protein n=1 Tax=Paramecium sonneborni TaxID=65129 RepID=A0A8S1LJZ4_9CILI|nr:unnamed protein product [Paramecium sonneborni]
MSINNIKDVCNKTIHCQKQDCQQTHQRKYVGLCLEYLKQIDDDEDKEQDNQLLKCSNPNCKLYHFNFEQMNILFQIPPINGIWMFNLCTQNNCNLNECQFLHLKWAQGVCLKQLFSNRCKSQQCQQQKRHISWQDLREEVYQQYNIAEINPEIINESGESQYAQNLINKNLCIKYLKGECPELKCSRIHCQWEEIQYLRFFQQILYPCTNQNSQYSFINFIEEAQNTQSQLQILCEKEKLRKLQKEINQANIIDIIFIVDFTKSMKNWLKTIKFQLVKIINQFSAKINGYGIRVGFVGYRDICEEKDQLIYRGLTENLEEIFKFISQLEAQGGGDQAEDVIAGLKQGLKLNISLHPNSILCTFLIADAPCHGKQYHNDNISDDQNDTVENQSLENVMKQYKDRKKFSFFTCFKINDSTDIMFQKMQEQFPELMITKKSQPNDFPELVAFALESSITFSLNPQILQQKKQYLYTEANFIRPTIINLDLSNKQIKKSKFWENFYDSVDQFQRSGVSALEINQEPEIIQNDAHRNTCVFKIFDAQNNIIMLAKLSKEHVKKFKENQLSKNDIKIAEEKAKVRYYVAAYANELAYRFRQKTKEFKEIPPIFYASPILYTLTNPFYGVTKLYAETYIDSAQYNWRKYSNNGALSYQEFYYYTSFSHFTYAETEGTLVILDLQGSDNIFSDASAQTLANKIPILEQDNTNQKEIGIDIFLKQQHQKCSIVCQKLGLSRQNFQNSNQNIDEHSWNIQDQDQLQIICEKCLQLRYYSIKEYRQKKEVKCENCIDLDQQPIEAICRCCQNLFHYDPNEYLQSLNQYGYCKKCKSTCIQQQNKCLYCSFKCSFKLKQIAQSNLYICPNGYQYLQTIYCSICQMKYQFLKILSLQEYQTGKFICCQNT